MLQALLGIMPTQQRLDALDAPRRDVDLRLIVQQELLLIERRPQLVLQTEPLGDIAVHLDLVVQVLLAGFLGLLERRLGALRQGVAVLAVDRIAGDARLERGA